MTADTVNARRQMSEAIRAPDRLRASPAEFRQRAHVAGGLAGDERTIGEPASADDVGIPGLERHESGTVKTNLDYYNRGMNSPDSLPLGFLLADASRLLRRRFERESRDIPMTPAQLRIVARLCRDEGIGQAALAALLDLEPMTLSRHVDRMVGSGLIERRPDPADRRARRLYTTERSRALLEPMRERAARIYDEVQHGLDPAARAALHDALATLVENLRESEPEPVSARADKTSRSAPDAPEDSADRAADNPRASGAGKAPRADRVHRNA